MGISSKDKRLTGLDQNQNFGQVALEFYLVEALSNLPEFGSEQTMKFEATYEHNVQLEWNSSHTGESISQCGDPLVHYIQNMQFLRAN